jgi:hypothetical protein
MLSRELLAGHLVGWTHEEKHGWKLVDERHLNQRLVHEPVRAILIVG